MDNVQYPQLLRKKLFIYSTLLIVFIAFIFIVTLFYAYQANYNRSVKSFQSLSEKSLNHIVSETTIKYEYLAKRMAINKNVKQLIKTKNRKKLYKSFNPMWKLLQKEDPYLKTMLFVLPNGKVFLRMHKPNVFDDDLTNIRPMIKHENRTQTMLTGYETGRFSTVYRIITPIFDNGRYMGALDIGINPNYIIDKMREMTGYNGALFIKKGSLKLFGRKSNVSIGQFVLQSRLNDAEASILKNIDKRYIFKNNYTFSIKGKKYYLHIINIKDYLGNVKAKIVLFQDITKLYKQKLYFMYILIVSSVIPLVFILFFISILMKKLELKLLDFHENYVKRINEEKKALENFKKMFDNFASRSPFSIYIKDEQFRYVYVNKTFKEWRGCKEPIGENAFDVFYKSDAEHISKDDRRTIKDGYLNIVKTLKSPNGEDIILNVRKFVIEQDNKKYIGGIDANITENYMMHKKIAESEYALKQAQKVAHIGHWKYDLKNKKLMLSDELYNIFGFSKDDFHNSRREFLKFVHKDDVEKLSKAIHDSQKDDSEYIVNYRFTRPDNGSLIYLEARYKSLKDENGQVVSVVGTTQDVTERTLLIKQLEEKDKLMLAQSRNAAMGEMISMIAHQWRQPLSVIAMGVNNIIIDIELDSVNIDELKRISNEILDQTQHLSKTIDDFRNFFKPKKDTENLFPKDVIAEALKFIGKSLENNLIAVKENYNIKSSIKTYSRELLQVLITIIQNAKEALVERNIKDKYIQIDTYEDEDNVYIKICDNAGGIDESIMSRIFEPYFSTKEEQSGTGLGLYMSKTIVEKHLKGKIWAENSPEGICFIIELPKKFK